MKTLRARYSLQLGLVLLVATLLPMLALYGLSASGLIEATYAVESRRVDELAAIVERVNLALGSYPGLRVLAPCLDGADAAACARLGPATRIAMYPAAKFGTTDDLAFVEPEVVIDPARDAWRIASDASNVIITSSLFHFRVEMPARFAIGALPVVSLGLGLLLSVWMSRSVTRPVAQLAEAARRIGRRDLACRVPEMGSLELQDLARSFNRMAGELAEAEAARRSLMADVAHELRTPLTVLEGNLRALLDGVRPLDEAEIALLAEQTLHLNRLVDDLRDLSLAESERLALDRGPVDLGLLLAETAAHFAPLAEEQGVILSVACEGGLVHPLLDDHRLRQVLHNLLANALRHTPRGGEVRLAAGRDGETRLALSVTDTGEGISPDDLPHVFDRFYRAARGCDRGGSGLGLAIVRALVDAQGGIIAAASPGPGRGSMFCIRFPLAEECLTVVPAAAKILLQ